jgi:tetratricopeptide (TPR) repeat protein
VVLVLGAAALQAVVVGRSRGAALGLVAGVAALLLLRWSSLSAIARRAAVGGALAATLLSGALFAGRLREDDPYRWTRMRIWAAGVEIARRAPWLGCGPGQFPVAAAAVRFPDPVGPLRWDRSFSTPHSDVVRLPAEFGVPAALAVGLALALALSRAIVRGRAEDGLARASSLAAFVALAVQATVDDLTTRPAIVVLGAMLLGSAAARPRDGAPARVLPRSIRLALATVGVVVFLAGDLAPWLAWRTLHGVPRRSDTEARLTRALALNPVHPDVHLRLAELRLRTGLRGGPDYARARREAEAAVRLSPRDARYRVGLARVEVAACHALFPDEATRARASANYTAAASLAPFDPWVPLEQGRFLLSAGDVEGALRAAERARELEPQALPPRLLLGRARLALGGPQNVAAARDLLGQAEMMAARHSATPRQSPYAASMLSLDLQESSALRRALDQLR